MTLSELEKSYSCPINLELDDVEAHYHNGLMCINFF